MNKDKVFKLVKDDFDFEELFGYLSESARLKGDTKTGIEAKIEALHLRARQAEILHESNSNAKSLSENDVEAG